MTTIPLYPRQVWWCQIVNDPFIIEFEPGAQRAKCPLCGWVDDAGTAEEVSATFQTLHDYLINGKELQSWRFRDRAIGEWKIPTP